jgi:Leucine-rich repeat (LRR) protein
MNKLIGFPQEFCQLTNLKELLCFDNQIKRLLPGIGQLVNLKSLNCSGNKLKTMPTEIGQLNGLRLLLCHNNEIEYMPPNVQRLITTIHYTYDNNEGIYNDTQSTHNHNIQECVRKSICYVMSQKPHINNDQLTEFITNNDVLNETTKQLLFEYMKNKDAHSVIGVTFSELLLNVISLVVKHKHKNEILNILNTEMQESNNKCFTGRMSRLINCLNGFDKNIQIKIADNEQIANVILQMKNTHTNENTESVKEKVYEQLRELGYDDKTIYFWLEHIE